MRKGFTLVELLMAVAIIGVLAAIVIIAINPTKQLNEAEGAGSNVAKRELENAIVQYIIDGNTFTGLPSTMANAVDICRSGIAGSACTDAPVNGYDLSPLVPDFLADIPQDPDETDLNLSGYRIYLTGSFVKICNKSRDAGCGS